jgi:uncharacterized membrane protein YbhN (UPF0104 family)
MVLNAAAMMTPIPGLAAGKAFVAQQASTAISNVIPGPSGTAARFAILHSWRVSVEEFTRSTFAVSVWSNVAMISMPGLAFLVLAVAEGASYDGLNLYLLAGVTALVSVAVIALIVFLLRSVTFTRWMGRVCQRIWNFFRHMFRQHPVADLEAQAEALRTRTLAVIDDKGGRLTGITLGNYWFNGLLLVTCIWWAGIPVSALPVLVGLAAYTAVFVAVLGERYHDEALTGVLVYRLLTYLMPILVGGVCYLVWRLMRRRERSLSG